MLVKMILGNVEILNREAIIEQLQKGNDKLSFILKPKWFAEHATVGHLFSVPGWTEEDMKKNDACQSYAVFLKGNGEFSIDLELDEILEEEP